MSVRNRHRGALFGLAIGDALGTTIEFQSRGTFEPVSDLVGGGPFDLNPGEWTDDTSMALCLAESLLACHGFDARDQMNRYVRAFGMIPYGCSVGHRVPDETPDVNATTGKGNVVFLGPFNGTGKRCRTSVSRRATFPEFLNSIRRQQALETPQESTSRNFLTSPIPVRLLEIGPRYPIGMFLNQAGYQLKLLVRRSSPHRVVVSSST